MVEVASAVWMDYLPVADAALAALEEPTEAMLRAGCEHLTIQGTWRSMIRAAGKDK